VRNVDGEKRLICSSTARCQLGSRVAALIASGQVAQITFHLNRAMDNGLTREQAAEVITHLAFYARWPNAMSALPVAKEVFAMRAEAGAKK
jgi:4-carboxymuconolactone decarboxylase